MAAAGKVAQRANEEFRRWKTHEVRHPTETNSSAFARAKHNREDAYAELARINARAEELRETDFELQVQEAAAQQNTTKEKILKAILRRKQEAGMCPLLRQWISGRQSAVDELWTPDNPFDLENTTWSAIVEKEAIFEALIHNGEQHFSHLLRFPFLVTLHPSRVTCKMDILSPTLPTGRPPSLTHQATTNFLGSVECCTTSIIGSPSERQQMPFGEVMPASAPMAPQQTTTALVPS